MPFRTRNLNEAALLVAHGHHPTRTTGSGAAVTFEFDDVDATVAEALIASDAYRAAAAFRRAWVECRRLIEAANGNAGRGVPR